MSLSIERKDKMEEKGIYNHGSSGELITSRIDSIDCPPFAIPKVAMPPRKAQKKDFFKRGIDWLRRRIKSKRS